MTKIDIFSGFLGAGKTTLIKKLIKEAYSGEKLVLVENEFGEIGVDGTFMQDAGITVNELNSGCICCSLVGDFAKALHQVIETYHPDRVLIEPSGVGKLSDVITAVQKAGVVGAELNTFTTVVDATKAKMYMKNFGEFFNNQVENASCIIFSHTDVANEKKLEEALALVKEHNPGATVILTPWDQLSGADIPSAMEHKDTLEMELQRLRRSTKRRWRKKRAITTTIIMTARRMKKDIITIMMTRRKRTRTRKRTSITITMRTKTRTIAAADIITIIMTTRMRMGKNITIITTATKTRTMVAADTITTIIMRMKFSEAGACRPGKSLKRSIWKPAWNS